MITKRYLLPALLGTGLLAACSNGDNSNGPPPVAGDFDAFADYGLFLNVLTPGQADCPTGGQFPGPGACPENFTDQQVMYENLVFTQPGQLAAIEDLVPAFYKNEAFVAADGTPPAEAAFVEEVAPSDDAHAAVVKRDSFGIPHIYGDTRANVMFGSGYATAQDRMFLMDALRHVGRGRQSDFVGGQPPDNYDRSLAIKAAYDEAELQQQIDQLDERFGPEGAIAQQDVIDYVAGVNAYIAEVAMTPDQPIEYTALNIAMVDFTPRDVVAIATLVQAIFAVGGGNEHNQVRQLHELLATTGNADTACQLWRDLRHFDDPEKPTTADKRFETQSPPTVDETACPFKPEFATQYPGAVMFDRGSLAVHDPLTVEECFLVEDPIQGLAECPDYGGTVVDDTPAAAAAGVSARGPVVAAPVSGPSTIVDLQGLTNLVGVPAPVSAPPALSALKADAKRMAAGRQRAHETLDGIRQALALADQGLELPTAMSNALLVSGSQTVSGHPIAVFGPQTGYTAPQLLLEMSQQGGDMNNRGMTFAGLPYVVIGRGVDFAWSATSSGDDIIDTRVLRLCEPEGGAPTIDSLGYLYNGVCKPITERFDEWTAEYNAGAQPPFNSTAIGLKVTRRVLRAPDYGPVFATATVNGVPVALATQRSTYFGEVDSAIPFIRTSRNEVYSPETFYEAFNRLTGTFNWFYIDSNDIAYFNSGLLPVRADGVHPDLPAWGDGTYDWKQTGTGTANPTFLLTNFLPLEAHPRQSNPSKGWMTSWNNAQAPGFWAAEHQGSYGPLHRSLLLDRRLLAFKEDGRKHTPMTMVEIMESAGTTDLRGQEVLPSALAILASPGPALTEEQAAAVQLLVNWVAGVKPDGGVCEPPPYNLGAMRRDCDGNAGAGQDPTAYQYDHHAAVVLMDRWWDAMVEDVLPQIHALENSENGNVMIEGRHDAPGDVGSAFISGYYGSARRVFDMALGISEHPYQQLKCAGADGLPACRAALVSSLQKAIDAVVGDERPEEYDAISHSPVGLAATPEMHWVNRPTWQQVIQPTGRRDPN